jgi:hypothetical protein
MPSDSDGAALDNATSAKIIQKCFIFKSFFKIFSFLLYNNYYFLCSNSSLWYYYRKKLTYHLLMVRNQPVNCDLKTKSCAFYSLSSWNYTVVVFKNICNKNVLHCRFN